MYCTSPNKTINSKFQDFSKMSQWRIVVLSYLSHKISKDGKHVVVWNLKTTQ